MKVAFCFEQFKFQEKDEFHSLFSCIYSKTPMQVFLYTQLLLQKTEAIENVL